MGITSGELSAAALLISIVSGFVVAYQFEPAAPFEATVAMEAALPWGWFWRGLHFWSSQAFFLLLVWHTFKKCFALAEEPPRRLRIHWSVITMTLGFGIFALFSGYVVRYDGTGQAAGTIAEHLMLSIPAAGKLVDRLLLGISNDGMNRLYAVHILMGVLCWGLGTWYHTRRVVMSQGAFLTALSALAAFSMLVHAPLDVLSSDMHLIKGPWFFLGIQEMLRGIEPFWAGIVFPAVPVAVAGLLPWCRRRWLPAAVVTIWGACYMAASITAILRSG